MRQPSNLLVRNCSFIAFFSKLFNQYRLIHKWMENKLTKRLIGLQVTRQETESDQKSFALRSPASSKGM